MKTITRSMFAILTLMFATIALSQVPNRKSTNRTYIYLKPA